MAASNEFGRNDSKNRTTDQVVTDGVIYEKNYNQRLMNS